MTVEAQRRIFGLPIERWQRCPDGTELFRIGPIKQAFLDAMRLTYVRSLTVRNAQTIDEIIQAVELPRELSRDSHIYKRERPTFIGEQINQEQFKIRKGLFIKQVVRYRP